MTIRVFYPRIGTSELTSAHQDYKGVANWEVSGTLLLLIRKDGIVYIPLVSIVKFREVL